MADNLAMFLAALLGGIVTGGFALLAVQWSHKNDLKKQSKIEEDTLQGFYQAILTEIETLWQRYQETAGYMVDSLKSGEPFLAYYPVTKEYFVIYKRMQL